MKTITAALVSFLAGVAMISGQETGLDSSAAARIKVLEFTRFVAQGHKDNATLDRILDHALVWVDPDGVQLSKAEYLAKLRSADSNVSDIRPLSMTIRVLGTTAVVSGIYCEKGVKGGRSYVQRARFINTWAFQDGRWLCIAATATSSIR